MNLPFRFYAFVLTLAALSGCATQGKPPPTISLDEPVQAQPLPEPPKPVEVVAVPEPLALPAQLKPLPEWTRPAAPEPARRCAFRVRTPRRASRRPARVTSTRFKCGPSPMARFIRSMPRRGA